MPENLQNAIFVLILVGIFVAAGAFIEALKRLLAGPRRKSGRLKGATPSIAAYKRKCSGWAIEAPKQAAVAECIGTYIRAEGRSWPHYMAPSEHLRQDLKKIGEAEIRFVEEHEFVREHWGKAPRPTFTRIRVEDRTYEDEKTYTVFVNSDDIAYRAESDRAANSSGARCVFPVRDGVLRLQMISGSSWVE